MATPIDDCWRLLRSLDPAEKAYVKRFAWKDGARSGAYPRLLDAMDAQRDAYDEAALRQRFSGKGGFRSFPQAKHQLYRRVLECLLEYHADRSPEDRLLRASREVRFLLDRGLDGAAERRLRGALRLADDLDLPAFLPPLLQVEAMLIPYTPEGCALRLDVHAREAANAEVLANLAAYRDRYTRMTALVGKWGVVLRDPRHVAEADALLADPLLRDENRARHVQARYLFHSIHKILHQVTGRHEPALEHAGRLVRLFEEHPGYRDRQPEHYLMALANWQIDLVGLRRFDEFDASVAPLETYLDGLDDSPLRRRARADLAGRVLYRQLLGRRFLEAARTADRLERLRPKAGFQPHLDIQHRYLLACARTWAGETEAALEFVLDLLQDEALPAHRDFHGFTLLLQLILRLERDEREHLAHATDAVRRVLARREHLYGFESALLRFLRRYDQLPLAPAARREAFTRLRDELLPLREDPFERQAFDSFDYPLWLEARIHGRSLREAAESAEVE